jgi:hypothetical protein
MHGHGDEESTAGDGEVARGGMGVVVTPKNPMTSF